MESCLFFAPSICVTWKSDLQFWEVGMTALISALTIVASIFIARSIAKSEVRRARESDRRSRRSIMIREFSDLATDLLHREHAIPVSAMVANFSARVSPMQEPEDFEAGEWMQDAISEMISVKIGGRRDDGEEVRPEWVMGERVDDLRGWARWSGTWGEYVQSVEPRAMLSWKERRDGRAVTSSARGPAPAEAETN